ncbi:MAG: GH25 family lysozyme [Limisphaerales bacterium]
MAQQERVLGLDVSAWQGDISEATWNSIYSTDNRRFVFIRSTRGGTTGYYNQSNPNNTNPPGQNTLSQRYDDPYFVQNITRSTAAGLFAGSYHFSRPDIIESTSTSGGIRNTGTDEADHFIEMAGAWMRPGYLLPVHDLEAGSTSRTANEMAQFCIEFSDRIYEHMGIRPAIYLNGSYAQNVLGAASSALRNELVTKSPVLWSARFANPSPSEVQTAHPKDSFTNIYGPWDDYGITHPWTFWQYTETGRISSYGGNLDLNVAQGGMEFLRDQLVPAVWMNDSSGDWGTLTNWNSGQTAVAPVQGPGQVARVGPLTLPTPRLPQTHDTVIIERPNAAITVTLASGTHNIRKLFVREETLNITGGTLFLSYVPSWDSWDSIPLSARFSGPVTLSGGNLNVHTLQVDATRTFTLSGGTLICNTLNLMPHASSPAKLLVNGNPNFLPRSGSITIANGSGAGNPGRVDLGAAQRVFNLGNSATMSINTLVENGGITKTGLGTLRLGASNTYTGGTTLSAGTLLVQNTNGSATGSGSVTVDGGTLGGNGRIGGNVIVNSGGTLSPGTTQSFGTLTLGAAPVLGGTTHMKVQFNEGVIENDSIILSNGTLQFGGALVVSTLGQDLILGGEQFKLFTAGSYSGAFTSTNLPALDERFTWDLSSLGVDGTIKVNFVPWRLPVTLTHNPGQVLQIPLSLFLEDVTEDDGDPVSVAGFDSVTTNGIPVLSDGTFIYYSNNVSVADQFYFTLTDGRGGNGRIAVNLLPGKAGRFANAPSRNGNSVTLQLGGLPGSTYYVERSTNLPTWVTISTNVAPAPNGLFNFTDHFQDLSQPPSSAYYRLKWFE